MDTNNIIGKIKLYLIDFIRGTSILKTLNKLRKQQYLSPGELATISRLKLEKLFQLAKTSTDFYAQFNSYNEIPVLTKPTVIKYFPDFISRLYKKKLIKKTTGGSTAEPFNYYTTKESQSWLWAGIFLSWETAGYRLGDKVTFIAGSSLVKTDWKHKIFYFLLNVKFLYSTIFTDDFLKEYTQKIRQNKSAIIYGYPNAINIIAGYLNSQPLKMYFPHLKAIVCTSELLTGAVRENIEKAFNVKVYNQYGCNEAGVSAYECEYQHLHMISSRAFYEVDEKSTLISTDLTNEGFIMMKFNTGDIIEFSEEQCLCQRSFPVIQNIVGRLGDVMIDMDNNVFHRSFFAMDLINDSSINQYQVSFTNDSFELNIHGDISQKDKYEEKYLSVYRKHAKFKNYQIKINEPFILSKNGKLKDVLDKREMGTINP